MSAVLAVGALALLAIAIFAAVNDRSSQREAWRRIALARRRNWEQRRQLRTVGAMDGCPHCGFIHSDCDADVADR